MMIKNYRYVGRTSKEVFVIKGINVFSEKWKHAGGLRVGYISSQR